MTRILRFAAILLGCTSFATLAAAPAPDRLETVLHQLDEASTRFRSAQADFKWDLYERVVKETTTQTGSIFFERTGAATAMGAKIQPPNTRVLEYRNATLRIFDPGANHITEIRAGNNQAQYEGFLTLGFGGSGRDIARVWNITDQGTEQLSDGAATVSVEKLDLVAKDPAARNNFSHVTIWVDPTRGISLKQQLFTPSGDYRTSTYTNLRYNTHIDTAAYAIKPGKNVTIDRR